MPWTAPRDWSSGELVTEAIMDTHIRDNLLAGGPHLIVRKTSDQTNNTTILTADTALIVPVAANEVWRAEYVMLVTSPGTADFVLRFTFPTGGTTIFTTNEVNESGAYSGTQTWFDTTSPGGSVNLIGHGEYAPLMIWGIYINGGTAGDLGIQWAQAVASGTPTTVRAQSTVWGVKLA